MIPNVLQPYALAIRWIVLLVFVLLLLAAGFKCGKNRGEVKLERAHTDLVICAADKNTLADALNDVNARAEQAKRDAADQRKNAVTAINQADKDRAAYEQRVKALGKELADAMQKPSCRIEMEKPLCAPLH